jgi:hypothetical protein
VAANNKFDFAKELSLPAGKYYLVADMFNSLDYQSGSTTEGEAGMYVTVDGETKSVLVPTTAGRKEAAQNFKLPFDVSTDQTVTFGFKNFKDMTARWFVIDNVAVEIDLSSLANLQTSLTQKLAIQI